MKIGAAIVGMALLAGCGRLKLEIAPSLDQLRWQSEIGAAVNTHTRQIQELQRKVFGISAVPVEAQP